jgi:hypothetical protein
MLGVCSEPVIAQVMMTGRAMSSLRTYDCAAQQSRCIARLRLFGFCQISLNTMVAANVSRNIVAGPHQRAFDGGR